MAQVQSEICRMALAHLGVQKSIVNIETDQSNEARACKIFYNQAVREILEDFPWPFATVLMQLALVENFASPEYKNGYAYPSNCMVVRRLFSQYGRNKNDDVQSRVDYRRVQVASPANAGQQIQVILCDHDNMWVEYTSNDSTVSDWSPSFISALSYKLATYIAPQVAGGDPFKLGPQAMQNYMQALRTAETHAANEEIQPPQRLGEFIDSRQGTGPGALALNWQAYPSGIPIE